MQLNEPDAVCPLPLLPLTGIEAVTEVELFAGPVLENVVVPVALYNTVIVGVPAQFSVPEAKPEKPAIEQLGVVEGVHGGGGEPTSAIKGCVAVALPVKVLVELGLQL